MSRYLDTTKKDKLGMHSLMQSIGLHRLVLYVFMHVCLYTDRDIKAQVRLFWRIKGTSRTWW